MTTAEFERTKKEFGKLSYWEQALNQIRAIRECPNHWSVKFHSNLSGMDIALPCVPNLDLMGSIEETITEEYKKQKQICNSIKSPYEQGNP